MRTFLKILLLLILLTAITLVTVYSVNKEDIHRRIRLEATRFMSEALNRPVRIGSVRYLPFQSVILDHVAISGVNEAEDTLADINSVTITVDMLKLLREKRLKTTLVVEGFHSTDLITNFTLRTLSRKAATYAEAADTDLIESVSILEAVAGNTELTLRDIFGILEMDRGTITSGKLHFECKDTEYLADFTRKEKERSAYDLSVRSRNLGFTSRLVVNRTDLLIEEFRGMFYTLRFDLKGEALDLLGENFRLSVNGTVNTQLESFPEMPGEIGRFARAHPMKGRVRINLFLAVTGMLPENWQIRSTVSATDLKIDKLRIKELSAKPTVTGGRLHIPLINGVIYGGVLGGGLKMDLADRDLPFMLDISLNDLDFGRLMGDLTGNKGNIYGNFHLGLELSGYAKETSTFSGSGSVKISEADLGPMPILTPLLGDVYIAAQAVVPAIKPVKIDSASMSFRIKNRRVETDDLILHGEDITINSEGYVDFDGRLDLVFENRLLDPSAEDQEWTTALRNAIVSFGRFLGKTRLTGTLEEPRWTK
ncbi:MAG: hypothetical protein GF409_04305 [Candidatus Omnitrophica bacterium]|nr:hypothetical protein [Candidatus Omnitrophota bacterium]